MQAFLNFNGRMLMYVLLRDFLTMRILRTDIVDILENKPCYPNKQSRGHW